RELKLRQALEHLKDDYSFIILDPPPGVGIIVANALVAANDIIVPLETRPQAWDKLPDMEALISKVRPLNAVVQITGIVCSKVDNTSISRAIEERARERYGKALFKSRIPTTVRISEAFAAGKPIGIYAP